jgi:cysteine desulfurase
MRIYLDHNATTPVHPAVAETVARLMRDEFGNASSVHAYGQHAKAVLDEARGQVAALLDAQPSELVFTAGGTEADNLAIRGAAEALEPAGRRHLVASGIEHEAVLETLRALERRGWQVTLVNPASDGILDPDALREAVTDRTALVSVMHANNEVGTIQPIAALAAIAHDHGALFHTDAVQSAGKIPVSVRSLGADLVAISGHKFGGPKGTGALWLRRGVRLVAQQTGGRQERNRRAGTENVPLLAGLGVAARLAMQNLPAMAAVARLRDRLVDRILTSVSGTRVNGDRTRRVPNTTNISFDGLEADSLLIALDLEGVAVSTGSACSSGSLEPSHVLKAMGLTGSRTRSALRLSLGTSTTEPEVDFVAGALPALVSKLRSLTRTAAALR